jgi:hypothetical protein
MIHPINLPEELLASNPTRPTLYDLRKRPTVTYSENGRRFCDGLPTSPRSVNNLWESALVRGFVHRMAYDVKAEVEETSSVESMIDVIDLHPASEEQQHNSTLKTDRSERYNHSQNSGTETEPQFAMSYAADGDILEDNSADGKGFQIRRRSSAQFCKTKSSAIIGSEVFAPILQPCCSSSELHNHLLKEFLRFDFSNSKVFSDLCEKVCKKVIEGSYNNNNDDEIDDEDDAIAVIPQRKTSIELLPGTIGSRIWFNKPLCKSNSIGPNFDQSFSKSCSSGSRSKLCFSIQSITISNDYLFIQILAFNSNPRHLRLETSLHLHSAKGQTIGKKFLTKEKIFNLQDSEENILKFKLNLNKESIKNIILESDEYIVITLLGHIHI